MKQNEHPTWDSNIYHFIIHCIISRTRSNWATGPLTHVCTNALKSTKTGKLLIQSASPSHLEQPWYLSSSRSLQNSFTCWFPSIHQNYKGTSLCLSSLVSNPGIKLLNFLVCLLGVAYRKALRYWKHFAMLSFDTYYGYMILKRIQSTVWEQYNDTCWDL